MISVILSRSSTPTPTSIISPFTTNPSTIEIVIARYNEDLKWIHDYPFSKYKNIIYNKGDNHNFETNSQTIRTVNLSNIGREGETYLQHIIQHYNDLADITIFLPGSLSSNMVCKYNKAKLLIEEVERHHDTVFVGEKYNNVRDDLFSFQLDNYVSSELNNRAASAHAEMQVSTVRPYGVWYDKHFNHSIQYVSYCGVLGISKKDILNHPVDYYKELLKEFQGSNPEVGHYVERSWAAIFYPLSNAKYIDYNP
jgi:hypothetical protein